MFFFFAFFFLVRSIEDGRDRSARQSREKRRCEKIIESERHAGLRIFVVLPRRECPQPAEAWLFCLRLSHRDTGNYRRWFFSSCVFFIFIIFFFNINFSSSLTKTTRKSRTGFPEARRFFLLLVPNATRGVGRRASLMRERRWNNSDSLCDWQRVIIVTKEKSCRARLQRFCSSARWSTCPRSTTWNASRSTMWVKNKLNNK